MVAKIQRMKDAKLFRKLSEEFNFEERLQDEMKERYQKLYDSIMDVAHSRGETEMKYPVTEADERDRKINDMLFGYIRHQEFDLEVGEIITIDSMTSYRLITVRW